MLASFYNSFQELLKTFSFSLQAPDLIPFDNPQHIDNVREENEGYGSKIYSIYDGLQDKTSDVFKVRDFVETCASIWFLIFQIRLKSSTK